MSFEARLLNSFEAFWVIGDAAAFQLSEMFSKRLCSVNGTHLCPMSGRLSFPHPPMTEPFCGLASKWGGCYCYSIPNDFVWNFSPSSDVEFLLTGHTCLHLSFVLREHPSTITLFSPRFVVVDNDSLQSDPQSTNTLIVSSVVTQFPWRWFIQLESGAKNKVSQA